MELVYDLELPGIWRIELYCFLLAVRLGCLVFPIRSPLQEQYGEFDDLVRVADNSKATVSDWQARACSVLVERTRMQLCLVHCPFVRM